MIPTLRVGDLILVNKYHYGLRMPVFNNKFLANNEPQRGDVMVFGSPRSPVWITSSGWWVCLAMRWPT